MAPSVYGNFGSFTGPFLFRGSLISVISGAALYKASLFYMLVLVGIQSCGIYIL